MSMERIKALRNSQIIILGICIAAATIISSVILSRGFLGITRFIRQHISVTGSARKDIRSDYVVWTGSFTRSDANLPSAYKKLMEDLEKVETYLITKEVAENEITTSQISTETIYRRDTTAVERYRLVQSVEIRSSDVDKIARISRESTELINEGVEFVSSRAEFFYTKLDELKVEMLARATENAKQRAENMVKATGNKIGLMRSAKMGVFQITPLNSTEVSDWGMNDTSSVEKKVTAVVNVSFAIE